MKIGFIGAGVVFGRRLDGPDLGGCDQPRCQISAFGAGRLVRSDATLEIVRGKE